MCLWTERKRTCKKERGQYPAVLTKQAWSMKDISYGFWGNFSCGTRRIVLRVQDSSILPAQDLIHFARSRSWQYNKHGCVTTSHSGRQQLFLFTLSRRTYPHVVVISGDPTEMMVTWVTLASTNYTVVEYNKAGFPLTLRASGDITKFTDGGSEHRVLYIHRVKLTGLVPDQMYGRYPNQT